MPDGNASSGLERAKKLELAPAKKSCAGERRAQSSSWPTHQTHRRKKGARMRGLRDFFPQNLSIFPLASSASHSSPLLDVPSVAAYAPPSSPTTAQHHQLAPPPPSPKQPPEIRCHPSSGTAARNPETRAPASPPKQCRRPSYLLPACCRSAI